jgi:hypothetical protein
MIDEFTVLTVCLINPTVCDEDNLSWFDAFSAIKRFHVFEHQSFPVSGPVAIRQTVICDETKIEVIDGYVWHQQRPSTHLSFVPTIRLSRNITDANSDKHRVDFPSKIQNPNREGQKTKYPIE